MATKRDDTNLSHSQLNAGDEFFDVCCTPCGRKNLNKEALKYCSSCDEYFCVNCVKFHNSSKALSVHTLLVSNVNTSSPRRSGRSIQAVPTKKCKTHPQKLVNTYCNNHDMVGCSDCISKDHKLCDDIHYIPQYVQSNFPAEQVHQVNNNLTTAIIAMKTLKTQHDRLDDNLEKSKAICKQEIQKYREDINQIIDNIEATTLAELDARHKDTKQKTNDTHQHIQDVHDEMVKFKSEIDSDHSNISQKFVVAKLSQATIMQGQELQSKLPHDQTTQLTFTRNTDIMTFLLRIVTLGMLSPQEIQDSLSTVTTSSQQPRQTKLTTSSSTSGDDSKIKNVSTRQQDTRAAVAKKPLKQDLYKVTDKRTCNIEHQHDGNQTCNIQSSCILDNGDILLADHSNRKLKLVDNRTYTIRSTIVLQGLPWSVCRVGRSEAAVLLHKRIQFVSTCDKLESTQSFEIQHVCICIHVVRDKMYVCSSKSVYIYTLNSELVQTIRNDRLGNGIFSKIKDITVSDDERMIHVADCDNGVITLNTKGDVVWRYSGRELSVASGVCTDGNGNVIVCGMWSHNLIQLGPDGKYTGEIVKHGEGVTSPHTVCYDRNNHKLIVGQYDNNNITIFTV